MKFKRVWHPFDTWEEVKHGMWADVKNRREMLEKAIAFTGDHKLYGEFMTKVVEEWPISTENALTDSSLNQKAWVGHAACAMALGCPEDITRSAWKYLTDEQRFLANKEAASAIARWRLAYAAHLGLCEDLAEALLP